MKPEAKHNRFHVGFFTLAKPLSYFETVHHLNY